MRINTNVSAINAHKNLAQTQNALGSSMQKLSSGFRINRAADDAAGLGIANALRAGTRSLVQASRNAEQANSLLQIAEGSTGTIQKMLERMKELATQAGSDSVDSAGRERINAEFEQLRDEIARTVDTTKFQGSHLLQSVAAQDAVDAADASGTGTAAVVANAGVTSVTIDTSATGGGDYRLWNDSGTVRLERDTGSGFSEVASGSAGGTLSFGGVSVVLDADISALPTTSGTALTFSVTAAVEASDAVEASGGPRSFLVSSSGAYDSNDLVTIDGIDLSVATLGIDAEDLLTAESAQAALFVIDDAMAKVSEVLGQIGAAQNRIEYAVDNVKTTIQNFAAAESVIRDVDMAEEMTTFSKNNILAQAGTAMLAQANQTAQGVLQLLRG